MRVWGEMLEKARRLFGRARAKGPLCRAELAALGEEAAARFLAARGYRIIERNYRARGGELDIIARQGEEVVFVEVKARTSKKFGTPAQSVSQRKQRKIASLARGYVARRIKREVPWRFDIAEVLLTETGELVEINLIPGAFRPEC